MASSHTGETEKICESSTKKTKNGDGDDKKNTCVPFGSEKAKRSIVHRTLSDPVFYSAPSPLKNQRLEAFEEEECEEQAEREEEKEEKVVGKDRRGEHLKGVNHPVPAKERVGKSNNSKAGTTFTTEFDEISTGLPSDLPSDLFDIAGDLVYGNVQSLRFGLEEDDFSSAEEDYTDDDCKRVHESRRKVPKRNNFNINKNDGKPVTGTDKVAFFQDSSHSPISKQHKHSHSNKSKKQYRTLCSPSTSSTKFAPIFPTCDVPSYIPKENQLFQENPRKIDGGSTAGANNRCESGNAKKSTACDIKKSDAYNARKVIQKQNFVEDLYHPLLINGNISKGGGGGSSRYPTLVTTAARRKFLSNQSSGSSSANNMCHNNSGNFSPPSDHFRSPVAPFDRHHSSGGTSSSSNSTITQHYYPEGGWGYVVLVTCTICHILTSGFQLSFGVLWQAIQDQFALGNELHLISCWLGAVSLGISLLFSPVWVSICKKKSTRLSAVFGGLVASLGCLFTSFASQFHQTFISYGAFLGIGVGLSRDASSLMVGQYFKRKRELVEIIVVSGSGLGIILMSISIHTAIGSLGWRLGLQAVTVSLILTFFLGTCYRSASLYHPQRRAILHLKNQKRKVKEKGKRDDRPPFVDYSCLRSKTLRIILMSSACTAFGIFTPLLSLAVQCSKTGFEDCSVLLLHVYIGTSWVIGCCTLGLVVIQKSQDCRVSKQYLCQVASVICGISILALTAVRGTNGMVVFSWVYGASLGGYCYSLKVYTYERARARHFPRAWSFLQSSQAIPLFFGVPLTNYANETVGWKSGYYMSAVAVFLGTACLFLTDVRRRKLSRRKSQNSSMKTCETTDGGASSPKSKRLSFAFPVEQLAHQQHSRHDSDDEDEPGGPIDPSEMIKEDTCISEEGLADVDFQDIYFEDWAEYIGECITSCNKVENCLVSEFDPDLAMIVERRARRWSAAKQNMSQHPPHPQLQVNPVLGNVAKGATAGTTGRLTLPGIGTVLEVPLLVAKGLYPNLGVRSHHPLHHHPHLVHGSGHIPQHHLSAQQHARHQRGGSAEELHYASGDNDCSSAGTSMECNFKRGGNRPGGGASFSSSPPGCSSTSCNTSNPRIYHHGKNRAASNLTMSHFPAIDEDSV